MGVDRHNALCRSGPPPRSALENNNLNQLNQVSRFFGVAVCLSLLVLVIAGFGQTPQDADSPPKDHSGILPASKAGASDPYLYSVSVDQLNISGKVLKHLESAHKRFSKRDLAGASAEIGRALEIDPECAHAFAMRALIKLASNDSPGALADATRSTLLDSNDALSFLALSTVYNSGGTFESAETAARRALQISPQLWQARLELAKSLYERNKFVSSLYELDALKIDFPDVHLVRGNVLMRLGRSREGVEEFKAFLGEAPRDPRTAKIKEIIADVEPVPALRF
jgi:Tfp pilus assembly protein PilF